MLETFDELHVQLQILNLEIEAMEYEVRAYIASSELERDFYEALIDNVNARIEYLKNTLENLD